MSDEIARETHDVHLRSRHPDYDPDVRCRANGCDQPARPSRSRDEWEVAMSDETARTLPPAGSVPADVLRALPEGSLIVTYRVGWAKTGPDEWRCPFRMHVADMSLAAVNQRFQWHDIRDSEWLAEVATLVVFNPAEWGCDD